MEVCPPAVVVRLEVERPLVEVFLLQLQLVGLLVLDHLVLVRQQIEQFDFALVVVQVQDQVVELVVHYFLFIAQGSPLC